MAQPDPRPRLASLAAEHRALEAEIRHETKVPAPDLDRIAGLKKRKLALKDTIALLSRRADAAGGGLSA